MITVMRLADHEARARLESHDHGILCTVHAQRGVDAVPVAYAVDDDGYVGVPIDRVKPKASLRLQRERNLEADPRATLLVEHWDRSDWSRLWWVRAELRWPGDTAASRAAALAVRLAGRYPQYQDQPFVRVLVLRIVGVTGWAAGLSPGEPPGDRPDQQVLLLLGQVPELRRVVVLGQVLDALRFSGRDVRLPRPGVVEHRLP
jgi:Pyridoxamine 5'-phosphate oxidase